METLRRSPQIDKPVATHRLLLSSRAPHAPLANTCALRFATKIILLTGPAASRIPPDGDEHPVTCHLQRDTRAPANEGKMCWQQSTPTKMPIHPTRALQASRATAPASPAALLIRVVENDWAFIVLRRWVPSVPSWPPAS
ncbi:hypothetical protein PSPO01_00209 [Paraphaeosphaeria sporulosa]